MGASTTGYLRVQGTDCDDADPKVWTSRSLYTDEDEDGFFVSASGTLCIGEAPLAGYTSSTLTHLDCDDTRAEVSITWSVFPDTDQDGVGAGEQRTSCAGTTRPAGYADTGTDCAPDDALRWRTFTPRFRDADGDALTVAPGGPVCLGASTEGSPDTSRGTDRDDTRAEVYQSLQVYVDTDGDGVGTGPALTLCTNGSPPAGHSLQGTDCAPDDALRWRLHAFKYVDADGDGRTVPSTGQVCVAAPLPPPYTSGASSTRTGMAMAWARRPASCCAWTTAPPHPATPSTASTRTTPTRARATRPRSPSWMSSSSRNE